MQRGPARTFEEKELKSLLSGVVNEVSHRKGAQPPEVMEAAFMLSFYAGLRVQEIAGLDWRVNVFPDGKDFRKSPTPVFRNGRAVLDSNGHIVMRDMDVLYINEEIGKYGKSRKIPVHPDLADALRDLYAMGLSDSWVIPSGKSGAGQNLKSRAHALKMRINRIYKKLGIENGSTHSGRRSFITRSARLAEAVGGSLVDVRDLAGHASINTTQRYVDPSARQGDLVNAVWKS